MTDALLVVAALFNLGIFGGYIFVAVFVAPELDIRRLRTRISGVLFFFTCGLTHLDLAVHVLTRKALDMSDFTSPYHLMVHGVQVTVVWLFVLGIYQEVLEGHLSWPLPLRRNQKIEE